VKTKPGSMSVKKTVAIDSQR